MLGFVTGAAAVGRRSHFGREAVAVRRRELRAGVAKMVVSESSVESTVSKPTDKPSSPCFSSGPCKKRPGYTLEALSDAPLGRSHRSKLGLGKIQEACNLTKAILELPEGYQVAIVPASDTGAVEMAMWSLLGERPVDICHWESFGKGWYTDAVKELKLKNVVEFTAPYGELPDLAATSPDHDIIFTWNGTTSGVRVPAGAEWISDDREGLTICDATSGIFAMSLPWKKLDVVTYSWQKVLGGEAAHGVIILSPRAIERLESYTPPWPMPKIFRMTKKGKFDEKLFDGSVINTVSMMCVEDYLDALRWVQSIGGISAVEEKSMKNLAVLEKFVSSRDWIHFLAKDRSVRSNTSVCLTLDLEKEQVKTIEKMLEAEKVAYDINSYREAPAGLRIWCGATVEAEDVASLCRWIEYGYNKVK
eukprot:Plantae.Rhodophyta-Purpureofilum_apyrenoidigerum.ctg23860.p1 GENE.Plantae.Rhodophyta-Purpureofilum_apyrenoidigerum.ctg23860~~Plantae.Rhodophyta-Purpureofilum_apyrenoidigerum.ctg23860.p1  ORF type:complete len:419 (+),score=78.51 Plantae.Rhodophyta-Purpureofilum_apyrenoidigerum.ctg23860:70-1326(+)